MKNLFCVISLARSGHNCFIYWLYKNLIGPKIYINGITTYHKILDNQEPACPFSCCNHFFFSTINDGKIPEKRILSKGAKNFKHLQNIKNKPTNYIFDFEDIESLDKVKEYIYKCTVKFDNIFYIYFVRDPFNCFASRMQNKFMNSAITLKEKETWFNHALNAKKTHLKRSNTIGIFYNDFLIEKNRKKIISNFKNFIKKKSDISINEVPFLGNSSSFGTPKKDNLERYKKIGKQNKKSYLDFFKNNSDIIDFSKNYFPKITNDFIQFYNL